MSNSKTVLDLSPELKTTLRERQYPCAEQFSAEEIVVLASFLDGPKNLSRLLEDEYSDAFSHGLLDQDCINKTLDELQSKGLIVSHAHFGETVTGFADSESRELQTALQSIARLTLRIAGDAAGLNAGASARASIQEMSVRGRL